MTDRARSPLAGAVVLEFGSLVPGPLTSLILAEAGAEVVKIERPPHGDDMRRYEPKLDQDSVQFHALNRSKSTLMIDLKNDVDRLRLEPWIRRADIIIDQFRPGVLARLGLGYDDVRKVNPAIIYCSLTGWGQTGPKAHKASHELNFLAESGHLDLTRGIDGSPTLPSLLVADIAGGVYPAVINILLAFIQRQITGEGANLDIAIYDGLMTFHYDTLVPALKFGAYPKPGEGLVTGGSPRYQIYATADARFLAVAAIEDKFWTAFCDMIGLDHALRGDQQAPAYVKDRIAALIVRRTADEWSKAMAGKDVCCSVVASLEEVLEDPHTHARGLLDRVVVTDAGTVPALPLPVAPQFRADHALRPAPDLPKSD
jgi:alpha-methylacyl-CoA racemase